MKVLASLSILLALLAVSQATAETRSITIGKFTYLGTGTQTRSDGTVIQGVSSYELVFDTDGVTAEPIPFSNAILFVKGSSQGTQSSGFPTITTGNGCGQNDTFPPCDLIFEGGPSSAGFRLAPCALQDNATETCISIALQLVSPPLNMNHDVSQNELLDSSHGVGFLQRLAYDNYRHQPRSESFKCACQTFRETSECVMACTVSATRFSTPTLRINLATCALTVRSPMPSGVHFIEMASAER